MPLPRPELPEVIVIQGVLLTAVQVPQPMVADTAITTLLVRGPLVRIPGDTLTLQASVVNAALTLMRLFVMPLRESSTGCPVLCNAASICETEAAGAACFQQRPCPRNVRRCH